MTQELDNFRREIDHIDDQIADLLKRRLGVVQRVGEFKRETAPGLCPIRPGREATMIRRIAELFKGTNFAPAAAAQLWRIIIGTATALEAKLIISVYATESERDLFWLAREYFGPSATIVKQPHIKRVIADVMDGKAAVGVVPVISGDDSSFWWTNLLQPNQQPPKIFAHLPFTYFNEKPQQFPSGFAFSRIAPEDSGDDVSLYVLEVEHNLSQSSMQAALNNEKLKANWVSVATLSPDFRHHLIEIKGFIPPNHPDLQKALGNLGGTVQHVHFLGAYAVPFTIKE